MQIETNMFTHNMHIRVCDKDPLKAPLIGEADVPLSIFTQHGPREEWIQIHFNGHPAGRVHFQSEFHHGHGGPHVVVQAPQVQMP